VNIARAARPTRLRVIIMAAALAIAGLLISSNLDAQAAASRATHTTRPKPIIVLEHGAWADGSSWSGVIQRLQAAGYTVYAAPNPLRGVQADAAYLHDFLTQNANLQGKPVVLVGHSYGGFAITNAAVGAPGVKALVYVDAFVPKQDDTLLSLTVPPSCFAADPATVFDFVPYPGGPPGDVDLYVKQSLFPGCFANGLPASQGAVLAATQRPLAASALNQPSGVPAWATIPSGAVVGTADHAIPEAAQLAMAQRAHARITRINAPHLSMISDPGAVTRVIVKAANATT
jgi:pimeloyl-ACP methyl ester carboxylesterase